MTSDLPLNRSILTLSDSGLGRREGESAIGADSPTCSGHPPAQEPSISSKNDVEMPCTGGWRRPSVLISHKVFLKSFCKSQFPHKSVNLFFIIATVARSAPTARPAPATLLRFRPCFNITSRTNSNLHKMKGGKGFPGSTSSVLSHTKRLAPAALPAPATPLQFYGERVSI